MESLSCNAVADAQHQRLAQSGSAKERARKTDECVAAIAAQILRVTPKATSREVAGYVKKRTDFAASTIRRSLRRLALLNKSIER